MALRLLLSSEPGGLAVVLALGLTYLLHSLAWVAAVALVARFSSLSSATRRTCWQAALFGPLLSAALATLALRDFTPQAFDGLGSVAPRPGHAQRELAPTVALEAVTKGLPSGRSVALIGLVGIGLGLLRFGGSAYVGQRRLRGRVAVTDARVLQRFARLRARMRLHPIKLTESEAIASPLVVGMAEVCVPRGLFSELSGPDMDAVLAHELAHIERRDGLWFPLVAAVQSLFWLQPLNHWVAARFRVDAELSCDDRAVQVTGSPLGLARALVHVAENAAQARPSLFAPTMVRQASGLLPRVRRLTDSSVTLDSPGRARGRWQAGSTLLVVGVALTALNVRVTAAHGKVPQRVASGVAHEVVRGAQSPVAISAQNAEMAELAKREHTLALELSALAGGLEAADTGSKNQVRALELAQELRHVRALQAFTEQRIVAQWSSEGESHVR